MHNLCRIFWILVLMAMPQAALCQGSTADSLPAMSQALLDAVGSGQRSVFERILAGSGLFTDEDGVTRTKAELIAQIVPLPKGVTGQIRMVDPRTTTSGNTAVVTYDALEDEVYFGQSLHARYHTTDVYQMLQGRWQLIGSQTSVIPSAPKPFAVAGAPIGLAGTYQVTQGRMAKVVVEGNKVFWFRGNNPPVELMPLGGDIYYQPGLVRGMKIFVRNKAGIADKIIDRRDNNDISWLRLND